MPSRRHGPVPALMALVALAGCSAGDGSAEPEDLSAVVDVSEPAATVAASTASSATTQAATTGAPVASAVTTIATTTTVPPTTVPEATGVPGLDSADAFCAAWSRFGGSWQVALAAGAFGGTDAATRLEVIAAPVVGGAYDAIFDVWPAELAGEQAVVADAYFGAFHRRSTDALAALERAGASQADIDAIAAAWLEALATRDPSNPVLDVVLPADLEAVVDAAAADFGSQRTPIMEDPSMVITASTPLTDEYLATACPDQGAITGSDVVDG